MKLLGKIYPLFFAVFPVLFYYNSNRFETIISSIFFPLFLSVAIYGVVYGTARLLIHNKNKLKLVLTLVIFYLFSYIHFANSLPWFKIALSNAKLPVGYILFVVYTLTIILLGKFLLKFKQRDKLAGALTIIGVYLIIYPLTQIVPWELSRISADKTSRDVTVDGIEIKNVKRKPDIYYIILDRYANGSILKDYYNFDNSDFLSFLEKKGFYIADKSFANFPKTHLSLASSLNLEYINYLTGQLGKDNRDYTRAFRMVQDNKVARILKKLGYYYIYFGDWWEPTRVNPYADENINLYANSNEFLRKFFSTTAIYPLIGPYLKKIDFLGFSDDRVYENLVYKYEKLRNVAKERSPKLVFVHMLMPHYPYLFDNNCNKSEDATGEFENEKYIEQLQCTNMKMKQVINGILKQSKSPPVIILQSDEGPFKIDEMNRSGEGVDWTKASDTALQNHMRILNTYYIPDKDGRPVDYEKLGFYQGISPVNSFRLIFNNTFDTNFSLLEDRSYIIPHLDKPYSFIDKTNLIRFDKKNK